MEISKNPFQKRGVLHHICEAYAQKTQSERTLPDPQENKKTATVTMNFLYMFSLTLMQMVRNNMDHHTELT